MRSQQRAPQMGQNYNPHQQRYLNPPLFDPTTTYYSPYAPQDHQATGRKHGLHAVQGQQLRDDSRQQNVRPPQATERRSGLQGPQGQQSRSSYSNEYLVRTSGATERPAVSQRLSGHQQRGSPLQHVRTSEAAERLAVSPGPQAQQSQDTPLQQYGLPSDLSSTPSFHPSDASRWTSNRASTDLLPSGSSAPIEMFPSRPTMATHRPPLDINQPQGRMALADYLHRSPMRNSQPPTVSQSTQLTTSNQRSNVQAAHQNRFRLQNQPQRHHTQHPPQASSTTPPVSRPPIRASSAASTTTATTTGYNPPLPGKFLPHSNLLAPQGPGLNRSPPQDSSALSSPKLTPTKSQLNTSASPNPTAVSSRPTSFHTQGNQPSPQVSGQVVQRAIHQGRDEGTGEGAPPPPKIRRVKTERTVSPSSINAFPRTRIASAQKQLLMRQDIVRPLDPSEAAIKTSYDPTTIARDVLIITNRHPTEEFLNHHLDIIRQKFTAVDFWSDLDTFRWDLVDPETDLRDQRAHRPLVTAPNTHNYQQTPANLVAPPPYKPPPSSFPSVAPSLTLPTQPPLPPAPQPQSKSSPVRPSHPPPSTLRGQPPTQNGPRPAVSETTPPTRPIAPPVVPSKDQPARPSEIRSTSKPPQQSPTPVRPTPTKAPSSSPQKKTHPEPQVVIQASPDAMPPLKRTPGRPRKVLKQVEVAIHNEPGVPFPVFRCAWSNCQSELHNMAALQSHVLKGHIPHEITCGWEGCDDKTPMAASKLWAHVQEKHIKSVAWALGDGPKVPPIGKTTDFALTALAGSPRGF